MLAPPHRVVFSGPTPHHRHGPAPWRFNAFASRAGNNTCPNILDLVLLNEVLSSARPAPPVAAQRARVARRLSHQPLSGRATRGGGRRGPGSLSRWLRSVVLVRRAAHWGRCSVEPPSWAALLVLCSLLFGPGQNSQRPLHHNPARHDQSAPPAQIRGLASTVVRATMRTCAGRSVLAPPPTSTE
jgi:hypothetical protein